MCSDGVCAALLSAGGGRRRMAEQPDADDAGKMNIYCQTAAQCFCQTDRRDFVGDYFQQRSDPHLVL